jgi:hypothetical protein
MNEDVNQTKSDDISFSWYQKPSIWILRIIAGLALTSIAGWYYFNAFLLNTPQTLPLAKRLIALMDVMHPGSLGEAFLPLYLAGTCAFIVFGIFLVIRKITDKTVICSAILFLILILAPYLLSSCAVWLFGRPESKIELIFVDKSEYKYLLDYINKNRELYYTYTSWILPREVTAEVIDNDIDKAYAELRKKARGRAADAIILFKDVIEERSAYAVISKDASGRKSRVFTTYIGPQINNAKFLNDPKYEHELLYYGKYITGEIVLLKDTDKTASELIKSSNSLSKRRGAI